MKEIKEVYEKYREVALEAQTRSENSHNYEYARKLRECHIFTGNETLEELIQIIFSPRGAEFLTTYNFPDISLFRKFKKYHPEQYGVYIDCGEIALSDEKNIYLIGNTIGEIKCAQTQGNRIILMCGAKANITASGYSVVKVETDDFSKADVKVKDHAKVLR